jgi:hypothetical protein
MGKILSPTQTDLCHEQGFISPINVMPEAETFKYAQQAY